MIINNNGMILSVKVSTAEYSNFMYVYCESESIVEQATESLDKGHYNDLFSKKLGQNVLKSKVVASCEMKFFSFNSFPYEVQKGLIHICTDVYDYQTISEEYR